jgi:hypothetical protein
MTEDGYRRRRVTDLARVTAARREPVRADRKAVPARRRRTVLVLAGAAAAVVAAGVVAVHAVTSGHEKAPGSTAPPRVLDAKSILLASADGAEKTPMAAHGSYWYSQIREVERARTRSGREPHGTSANGSWRSGPYYPFHAYVTITWENWDPYQQGQPSRTVDRDIKTSFAGRPARPPGSGPGRRRSPT